MIIYVVFCTVHPLADSDPAERLPAREETPAPEAVDFLANPAAHVDRDAQRFAALRAFLEGPQWTGPLPSQQQQQEEEEPEP